jgi:protein-glutamine gamma-glutamyltransferase
MRKHLKKPVAPPTLANQSLATLCSLCLCIWGVQVGVWKVAIPMALLLEGRNLVKRRWQFSQDYLLPLNVLCISLSSVAAIVVSTSASSPNDLGSFLLQGSLIALFPLILAQTYCANFSEVYRAGLRNRSWLPKTINLYYPYFGICVLAVSAAASNLLVFLGVITLLIAGFLGTSRSQRFSPGLFYGLIVLAVILSLLGSAQFSRLQASIQFNPGEMISQFLTNLYAAADDQPDPKSSLPDNQPQESPDLATPSLPPSATATPGSTDPQRANNPISLFPGNSSGATPDSPSATGTPSVGNTGTTRVIIPSQDGSSDSPPDSNLPESNPDLNTPVATASTPSGTSPKPQPSGSSSPVSTGSGGSNQPGGSGGSGGSIGSGGSGGSPNPLAQISSQIDPQKSQTRIGQRGSLQPADTILLRVSPILESSADSQPEQPQLALPLYLKAATFNQYQSGTWDAVNPRFFSKPQSSPRHWTFGSPTPDSITVRISTDLQQAQETLELPVGTSEIEQLGVDALQMNQYGTVMVQGKPGQLTYTAKFNPSQSFDSPPTPQELAIPAPERATLEQILKSLDINPTPRSTSAPETVRAITAFFQNGFRYSLDLPPTQANRTPIADFLLRHRAGHCEYYATATSLLLRAAGIPSRYVVGYSVHEYAPEQQAYLVRASDAHAWVTAYVNGTWVTLDTTPGNGQLAGTNTGNPDPAAVASPQASGNPATATPPGQPTQPQPAPDNRSWPEKLQATWSSLPAKHKEALLWFGAMAGLGLALLLTCVVLLWRLWRRKRRSVSGAQDPQRPSRRLTANGVEADFYLLEKHLGQWGLERQPAETGRKWMVRLQEQLSQAQAQQLQEIIDLHYRYRFDPEGISAEDRGYLAQMIRDWLKQTRTTLSRRNQRLGAGQG